MEEDRKDNKCRVLQIYARLSDDYKAEEAQRYERNEWNIQRDIDAVIDYLQRRFWSLYNKCKSIWNWN